MTSSIADCTVELDKLLPKFFDILLDFFPHYCNDLQVYLDIQKNTSIYFSYNAELKLFPRIEININFVYFSKFFIFSFRTVSLSVCNNMLYSVFNIVCITSSP